MDDWEDGVIARHLTGIDLDIDNVEVILLKSFIPAMGIKDDADMMAEKHTHRGAVGRSCDALGIVLVEVAPSVDGGDSLDVAEQEIKGVDVFEEYAGGISNDVKEFFLVDLIPGITV